VRDEILTRGEARAVAEYVLTLSGQPAEPDLAAKGKPLFEENCVACHQEGGVGDHELGAPNLTDAIWLYGGDRDTILATISFSRGGVMPTWQGRLDPVTIKQLAVFVHSLGGGE